MKQNKKEKDYYPILKSKLDELLKSSSGDFYLEITAQGFSRFAEQEGQFVDWFEENPFP